VDFDDHGAKLFVTSIMTAELIGRSTGHAAEDQAAAQSVDRSQGRQESCRRGRSKPVVSPSQVPQFLDPAPDGCRVVSACFSRSEIKDCGRFTRMKRFVIILGVILLVLGVVGLVHPIFTYHSKKKLQRSAPIKATVNEEKTVEIPAAVSIVLLAAGIGLVLLGPRMKQ